MNDLNNLDENDDKLTKENIQAEIAKIDSFKKQKDQIKTIETQLIDANNILFSINEQIKDVFKEESLALLDKSIKEKQKKEIAREKQK